MDNLTAKELVKNMEPDFLERASKNVNGKSTYICPICSNGSGSTGDGIAIDPTKVVIDINVLLVDLVRTS